MKNRKYRSGLSASLHEIVSGLYDAGLVDKKTMREFDESCLTPVEPLTPEEIVEIRGQANVSQRVFAHYLNVSPGTVSQWERGEKKPAGASLKLLTIVRDKGLQAIA